MIPSPPIEVSGFVPFTMVDYPDKLSAVVFCQGCPWRCSYCHNPHLQRFHRGKMHWPKIVVALKERIGYLDAVVFSGGEPTAQAALGDAIREVRDLGFLIGLHTAGIYPTRLAEVLPLLDWVGFDFKAPLDARYDRLTGASRSARAVADSLALLLGAKVSHQIRTTLDPEQLDEQDRVDLARQLRQCGTGPTRWQACRKPSDTR